MAQPAAMDKAAIIKSFSAYDGPGAEGCVIDFLGVKTRTCYLEQFRLTNGTVESYPLPHGNYCFPAMEWAGALQAVIDAREELVALELGAGWGPWLVTAAAAARQRGITRCRLVGVEGAKAHVEYMHTHFIDNGLNPAEHSLLHGVVGTYDGVADFPILEHPSLDWGVPAIYQERKNVRGWRRLLGRKPPNAPTAGPVVERVPCYSLITLLKPFATVDLVHFDIQGAEFDVIASSRSTIREKVKRLVIGTHGRTIEQQLFEELAANGWILEDEKSCSYYQAGNKFLPYCDGVQVWRNSSLLNPPTSVPIAA